MKRQIKYRAGYKYQLVEDYETILPWGPPKNIVTEYIEFYATGRLLIRRGYAWDGASGGARDTNTIMRGSLEHDAMYQLFREKHLDEEIYRLLADWTLRQTCLEDGMWRARAWWVYQGVRAGGASSADPRYDRPVLTAP